MDYNLNYTSSRINKRLTSSLLYNVNDDDDELAPNNKV